VNEQPQSHEPANAPAPLILDDRPFNAQDRGLPAQPGRALVFSTADGQAEALPRRPSFFGAFRYHHRFEVDISHHFATLDEELPSRDDPLQFRVTLEIGWRVSDPAQIVQARINDGEAVVRSRLMDFIRPMGRSFGIEDYHLVEDRINGQFGTREQVFPEGITVFRLSARVFLDEATTRWLEARRGMVRQGDLDTIEHRNKVASAQHEHELSQITQRHQAELEQERMDAVRAAAKGEDSLLLLLLARYPDQIHKVIEAVAQRREMTTQAQLSLFNKMVDQGYIQEVDVEPLRQILLRPLEGFADSTSTQMFALPQLAAEPSPAPPPPVEAGSTEPGGAGAAQPRPAQDAPAAPASRPTPRQGDAAPAPSNGAPGQPPGQPQGQPSSDGVVGWTPLRQSPARPDAGKPATGADPEGRG
jgi:hypothetical protein